MRKIIYGIFLFAGFIVSSVGIGKHDVQAMPIQKIKPVINNACDAGLVFSDVLKNQDETFVAWHYSHSSHSSHRSHSSHYSSRY